MAETMHAQTPMRFYDARFDASPLFAEAEVRPGLLTHIMGKLAASWDIRTEPGSLHVPLFIALGRHDYVVPHGMWNGIAELFPGAACQIFDQSGHQPFFEEPSLFADTLWSWMEERKRERDRAGEMKR